MTATLPDIDGLCVRRIPLEVVSIFHPRHYVEGDERIEWHGRPMIRRVRTPDHAGWWMCQICQNTGTSITWSERKHHLAPTLGESLAKLTAEQEG